ncbi:MAG: Maf family protein [Gammaproteobacteria bacterium]|jgi:septum formation protein|nr:Maf family protein [Gammaproteobacteria bacterium]
MTPPTLWLASRSPRRAELLRTLGVAFAPLDVEVDESVHATEAAPAYVARLAAAKAAAGALHAPRALPVLAADTTVVCGEEIFGKPVDRQDGLRMLRLLAGQWHEVYTGVVVATADRQHAATVVTRVRFRPLTVEEMAAYWASGEPADKAGGYGIQGLGGALIERIEGSYSNVVGLPLAETQALLSAAGVPHALG